MPLTDTSIRQAKPSASTVKLSDGGGLQIWIEPNGSKLSGGSPIGSAASSGNWRSGLSGRHVGEARERREQAKRLLAGGTDPMDQKRREKQASEAGRANTFGKIAAELIEKKRREGKAANTIGRREYLFANAAKELGERPIREITAADVLAILKKVERQGFIDTAHRFDPLLAKCSVTPSPPPERRMIRRSPFAARSQSLTADASTAHHQREGLRRASPRHRRVPRPADHDGGLRLMAVLFPRPGELRLAEWREFDMDAAVWTVPAARTKMRREHRVPLPRQAIAILKDLHRITGDFALIFPGLRTPKRPISENTLNAALRRMGYAQNEMTAHGFRAAASTLLNEAASSPPMPSSGRWRTRTPMPFAAPTPAVNTGKNASRWRSGGRIIWTRCATGQGHPHGSKGLSHPRWRRRRLARANKAEIGRRWGCTPTGVLTTARRNSHHG